MKIISVFNQKGGCSKTSTCCNVGAALASLGKNVLLIDCDPQANLTLSVGVDDETLDKTIYNLLTTKKLEIELINEVILKTQYENLSIIPSDITLSDAEINLSNMISRETILKRITSLVDKNLDYDYVLIDCPPSLGLLSINALCASNSIIVPVSPNFFSLKGIKHLLETIDAVKTSLNPTLDILGVLITQFDSRKNMSKTIQETLRDYFGDKVFKTVIRTDSQVEYSQDNMTPVIYYSKKSKAYTDYMSLAKEMLSIV
ncbi:MAG: ParA family protein [Clostridiaceae bacterium]